ncbi:MAG: hypothetical protein LBF27_15105 [Sphingobacterium sp.]|jgi:hypothetical protein|nr:hypothetical protein [Sphingobacterium sp.]
MAKSAKSQSLKKELKNQVIRQLHETVKDLQLYLNKKEFSNRIKKATKLLTEGIRNKALEKKQVTNKSKFNKIEEGNSQLLIKNKINKTADENKIVEDNQQTTPKASAPKPTPNKVPTKTTLQNKVVKENQNQLTKPKASAPKPTTNKVAAKTTLQNKVVKENQNQQTTPKASAPKSTTNKVAAKTTAEENQQTKGMPRKPRTRATKIIKTDSKTSKTIE